METNKFYVGQKVVAIKSHGNLDIKKGCIYTIKALAISPCKCKYLIVDVGISARCEYSCCGRCNTFDIPIKGFVSHEGFRPLSERSAESEAFSEETIEYLEKEIKETYIPS